MQGGIEGAIDNGGILIEIVILNYTGGSLFFLFLYGVVVVFCWVGLGWVIDCCSELCYISIFPII
jgi:hypothetical protein